jgi:hypothetical protein
MTCEWPKTHVYNNTLKYMPSVRQTTYNDLVYLETIQPNAKTIIVDRQVQFLHKLYSRNTYITNLAIRTRSPNGEMLGDTPENKPVTKNPIYAESQTIYDIFR